MRVDQHHMKATRGSVQRHTQAGCPTPNNDHVVFDWLGQSVRQRGSISN